MTSAESLVSAFCSWLEGPGFRRPGTAHAYRSSLAAFLREMKVEDLATVNARTLDDYVGRLLLSGLAQVTIRSRLFALRSFWKWAVSREHLPKDPMALVRIPADDGPRDVLVLDPEERARLFAAALGQKPEQGARERDEFFAYRVRTTVGQAERDYALLLVIFAAALRCSEAAALAWSDVLAPDKRDGVLAVIVRRSKRSSVPSRPIYLGREASAALNRWRSVARASGRLGRRVFGLSPSGIADALDRCARAAGVAKKHGRRVTPHVLRASRATAASLAGMDDRAVADLLRHENTETVGRYIRAADATTRRFEQVASLDAPHLIGARKALVAARQKKRDSVGAVGTRAAAPRKRRA